METKRFIGPDMRTALRTVREQLGPDAVILSNRRVGGGVEIVAADGAAFQATPEMSTPEEPVVTVQGSRVLQTGRRQGPDTGFPAGGSPGVPRDAFLAIQGEMRELRSLVERRLAGQPADDSGRGPGAGGVAWRQLTRAGLPNDVVRVLVGSLDDDNDVNADSGVLANTLAGVIPEAGDLVARGGVFAAVGPTGAGKTTTLCKLAVRHVLAHGRESLVIASADVGRLGGADMLRAVARLLEVPFLAANEGEPLSALVARAGHPALLLLDTPGLNRRRPGDARRLQELAAAGVNSLLVLPANAQLAWLDAALDDYRTARPVAAVITKLDETVSLGEAIGVLLREGLPFAYVTDGPEIPDDIRVCDAGDLARQAFALADLASAERSSPVRPAVAQTNMARIA